MEATSAGWRTSSYSGANGGQCIEVGNGSAGVLVRDSTDRAGATLALSAGAWRVLLAQLRADRD